MKKLYIYFDEYGHFSPNTGKVGSFSHFIYTGLIFQTLVDKNLFEEKATEILKKRFNGKLFKANKVNIKSKLDILAELLNLNWTLSILVVDQTKTEGALKEYEKSFIKFIQKTFLKETTENYDRFEINFDRTGSEQFQKSLITYIDQHVVKRDLFSQDKSYTLHDEKKDQHVLLCFTDLFTNPIGQYFCKSHYKEESKLFLEKIVDRLQVTHFPYKALYDPTYLGTKDPVKDSIIRDAANSLAAEKLLELSHHEEKKEHQILLEYVLLANHINPNRLLPLQVITDHLKHYFPGINDDRTKTIITDLRNMGVIIISSKGRAGYKLPNTHADFEMFFKRYLDSIVPMIKRINQSHDILFRKSRTDIDLLNTVSDSKLLRDLIAVIKSVN
ncbi:DUF3800 domain-containing protein [Daejeonella oryzae]|uniref:DUF3800 domain-containing protein n=1 Tax=Daejeonella oryzae TaxID=1122943 RepID=UPI00041B7182|nr:DUF3800 domain-containing protein [Daejeonella oryzae]